MRILSLRHIFCGALALIAGLCLIQASSFASAPVDPIARTVSYQGVSYSIHVFDAVALPAVSKRSIDHHGRADIATATSPIRQLKPEYVESYETHGLSFVKHRLLC